MGFALGFGFMVAISWIFRRKSPRQVDKLFRKLQLVVGCGSTAWDMAATMPRRPWALWPALCIPPA